MTLLLRKRNYIQTVRKTLLYAIIVMYAFSLFMFKGSALFWHLVFVLPLALLSLEKFDYKRVLVIVSLVFTYPLFYIYILSLLQIDTIIDQRIFVLIAIIFYILFYYLWFGKSFWQWIDKRQQVTLLITLSLFIIISCVFASMAINCYSVSGAEKGVTHEEIEACRSLGLYTPGVRISGTFRALAKITC